MMTRIQWIEMFEAVKLIEAATKSLKKDTNEVMHISSPSIKRRLKRIEEELPKMKRLIMDQMGEFE